MDIDWKIWGPVAGAFAGGALSAVIIEFFRRFARKEKYSELLYIQRLEAYGELGAAIMRFEIEGDIAALNACSRRVHLFSDAVIVLFFEVWRLIGSDQRDEGVQVARKILLLLRQEIFLGKVERLQRLIFETPFEKIVVRPLHSLASLVRARRLLKYLEKKYGEDMPDDDSQPSR